VFYEARGNREWGGVFAMTFATLEVSQFVLPTASCQLRDFSSAWDVSGVAIDGCRAGGGPARIRSNQFSEKCKTPPIAFSSRLT
jgi:hypothetical protein